MSHSAARDQVTETRSDFSGLWAILKYGKNTKMQVVVALSAIVGSAVAVMVAARYLGELVQALVTGQSAQAVYLAGTIFLALECFGVLFQFLGRLYLAKATVRISFDVRRSLFEKIGRLPVRYFDVTPVGRTLTRLTNDVEGLETFFSGSLARLVTSLIQVVAVLIAMLLTHLQFGLIVIAASLPALFFSIMMRKPVRYWLRHYRRQNSQVNARLAEFLNGMAVIRGFGLERWSYREFEQETNEQLRFGLKVMNWNTLTRPLVVALCMAPTLVILWLGGERVLVGTLEIGLLVAFVRYSERFISPIRIMSQEIQMIQEALVSSERIRQMLDEPTEAAVFGPAGQHQAEVRGELSFIDVAMNYDGVTNVLQGVSFHVPAGSKIGLVGATGSGKTTTVNLLPALYPLASGRIEVDGVSLTEWDREFLRANIGYVSQDVTLFRDTVRANLLVSMPAGQTASDEDIWRAAAATGLKSTLERLPKQLDFELVDGGDNLSMGERQLISFTRMLLRNPAVVILDEATANIDEQSEQMVQRAMDRALQGRTALIIAHRLSTVVGCDKILVFSGGTITESGTHRELLAAGGHYARLVARQLAGDAAPDSGAPTTNEPR